MYSSILVLRLASMSVPLLAVVAVLLFVIAFVEVVAVSVFDALGICSGVALL